MARKNRSAAGVLAEVQRSWAPPPNLLISEWADRYRWLSPEAAAEPGRWRTERFVPLRGVMDACVDPVVETTVFRKPSQIGYTEGLLNIIGRYIDTDPCPMLMVQPTLDMAEAWSRDRFGPMIRDTRVLNAKVGDDRTKRRGNRVLHKQYPGGQLTMAGANSPASLASRPIRVVLYDEIDRFPVSAGREGDPIRIGDKRTTNFWNRKRFLGGTPTVKHHSRVDTAFERSDQRFFNVLCPHCHDLWVWEWQHVIFDDHDPSTARLVCPHCGAETFDDDRDTLVAEAEKQGGGWIATKPFKGTAGFHINAIYSPWMTLSDLVTEFLESKDDPEELQVFVNTRLGESFERDLANAEGIEATQLKERADVQGLNIWTCPEYAVMVTAGVDTQDDRLAVEVWAWGAERRHRLLFWEELYGDPDEDDVWEQLDQLLNRPIHHPDGYDLNVIAHAVDSGGHRTHAVYNYVRGAGGKAMAIKGASSRDAPALGRPSTQDVNYRGKSVKGGVKLWPVGGHIIKDNLSACLAVERPGPRYVELPAGLPLTFYEQLCGEVRTTRYKAGVPYQAWVPRTPRQALEAWDCYVYAYAAALRCGLNRLKAEDILDRRRMNKQRPKPRQAAAKPTGTKVTQRGKQQGQRPRVKRSSYL